MSLPSSMKAAVLHGREDLRVETVPLSGPGPGGMIVRLDTALTCGTDLKVWRRGRLLAQTPAATAALQLPDRPASTSWMPPRA